MSTTRSLGREEITVSSTEVPLEVHRTDGTPTIFAGFHQGWMDGQSDHPQGKITYRMDTGVTSPYLTLAVDLPDGTTVYEYVNMSQFFEGRVKAILTEKGFN